MVRAQARQGAFPALSCVVRKVFTHQGCIFGVKEMLLGRAGKLSSLVPLQS